MYVLLNAFHSYLVYKSFAYVFMQPSINYAIISGHVGVRIVPLM